MPSRSLTEAGLLAVAGETVFGRGEDYVQYVRGLRITGTTAKATIQARGVYLVELDWSGAGLEGSCTCPHFAEGFFCKHLVAVGLCVIDRGAQSKGASSRDASDVVPTQPPNPVDTYLEALDAPALRDLVRELVERDPSAERLVEVRAVVKTGDSAQAADDLVASVNAALRTRGFVDYRRSFEVARDAEELLDELEGHLDSGAASAVRPALLRALTRLRSISLHADDSGGAIGDACQRAADLYARACREGTPDPVKLARWLVKFRNESPGWPQTTLPDFVEAFDDKALRAYRKAVASLDEKHADVDRWRRSELDRMLLELADHDGDVDRAIELLSSGEHPSYGAIVDRLREAGRHDDAFDWMDRGVREGRVSGHLGASGRDYWLDPDEVAEVYRSVGRVEDAIEVLRGEFVRRPGALTYTRLVEFGASEGRADDERAWALERARQLAGQRFGNGAALIEIALAASDLDAAWAAANEFGAGHMWESLVAVSSDSRPRQAADLYRPHIERDLEPANTRRYAGIADKLAKMRELYLKAGAEDAFGMYVDEIRTQYGRRTSLMAALDRKGL
jgi:uncharacterized Zn finger protein